MIYPMVLVPVTFSNSLPRCRGHGLIIDAFDVLCAKLTRDLFAIAKLLFCLYSAINQCEVSSQQFAETRLY